MYGAPGCLGGIVVTERTAIVRAATRGRFSLCCVLVLITTWALCVSAEENAEPVELSSPDKMAPAVNVSASTEDSPADFIDPNAQNTAAPEISDDAQPAAEGEKKADTDAATEKVPPPPVPSAEDLEKRRQRAADFQSLGEKLFKFPVTGTYYTRYRFRKSGDESDQDMYQFLSMDLGDKERHVATGHLDARWSADLDGKRSGLRADVFSGILDTYDSAVTGRLYSAYADFHKVPGVEFLRAGRQFNYDTPEIVQFDGLRLDTQPWFGAHEAQFSFYGGLPVHLYEHTPDGDALAGFAAEGRPCKSLRLRLDYIHVDDNLSGERADTVTVVDKDLILRNGTLHNDLVSLSLWQTFRKPDVRVQGRFSVLDGEPRDGLAQVTYNKQDSRLQVSATYRVWFERQPRLATEFDMFFDTLRGQEPYHHGSLVITKGWTENFWMETPRISFWISSSDKRAPSMRVDAPVDVTKTDFLSLPNTCGLSRTPPAQRPFNSSIWVILSHTEAGRFSNLWL